MGASSHQNLEIREFILRNLAEHSNDITSIAVKKFAISRAAVAGYMKRLLNEGLISAEGNTKARTYKLKNIVEKSFTEKLYKGLEDDVVWRHDILPLMNGIKQNIIDICQYGFTEMLNNAVDHSGSFYAHITYQQNYDEIRISISDEGKGIFNKIQEDFKLPDQHSALLELSKGKLTSDKKNHAGEGIFFTSRMFNSFSILSGNLSYIKKRDKEFGWLIESDEEKENVKGTYIVLRIKTNAEWTVRNVFNEFQGDSHRFRKTHVYAKLAKYENEQLVSRSQAKRILARFDKFSEILLDFKDIDFIGQAFADEIFRVFKNNQPKIKITAINTTPDIDKMIAYVGVEHE